VSEANPIDRLVMPEFTQGVCEDGAAILMDGDPLTIEEILERLRLGVCDEVDAARYRKLRAKNWTERGMVVVEKSESVKLGHMCLSHERLDAALDSEA
jgi:chromosome segregation and condensation protein ScpB